MAPHDGDDRTKNLLLRNSHRRADIAKDRWLVEKPGGVGAVAQPVAARQQPCALLAADFHVLCNGRKLCFADHRTHLNRRIEAVADAERFRAPNELSDEPVVDLLVDHHPAGGGTSLTAGAESPPQTSLDGKLELGVVHDHDDVLAAHLEVDLLERARSVLIDES